MFTAGFQRSPRRVEIATRGWKNTLAVGLLSPLALLATVTSGPARAQLCPDGSDAEFCLPPDPLPPEPTPTPTPDPGPSHPTPTPDPTPDPEPVSVDVYRQDSRLLPLGMGIGWQVFSRDLLEPLPQKLRPRSADAVPEEETDNDSAFRFSVRPGTHFSERDGWRLRVFGNGFGGPMIEGASGSRSSLTGGQLGLRLDYAIGDLVIGAFGRFGSLWADGGSQDALGGTLFSGRSTRANFGGGGLLVQYSKPSWFLGAAVGGDGLQADQPFSITSSNAQGIRSSSPSVGGSAFNLATHFGGRIQLSDSQFLEPSALLTLTTLSIGGATVFDSPTNLFWKVPSSSSTVGTADIGVTWKAPMRDGRNLITPSLRLSWLGAGFLGGSPTTRVRDSAGQSATLPTGSLIQDSGLGLQGGLSYTLRDNTTFYVRGGAGFYGGGTAWDVGGGLQLRWGGAPRGQATSQGPGLPEENDNAPLPQSDLP